MATTAVERKLLVGGEWIETGDWLEVRSPYSGDVVARVAKAGAAETKRAIDAAEEAMREPLPAHKRAEILVRVVAALARRHDEVARQISDEAGKPMKAARVEAKRAMSTYTFAAVEARKLAGDVVPMDAAPGGRGQARLHAAPADRDRRRDQPVQLPAQPRRAQARPRARGGLRGRAQAREPDPALGAAARGAGAGRRAAAGLGERRRRPARRRSATSWSRTSGSRRSPSRARARSAGSCRSAPRRKKVNLELGNATPVIVAADADLDDGAAATGRKRVLLRGPELHLGAAGLRRSRPPTTGSWSASCRASQSSGSAIPPTRRPTSAR